MGYYSHLMAAPETVDEALVGGLGGEAVHAVRSSTGVAVGFAVVDVAGSLPVERDSLKGTDDRCTRPAAIAAVNTCGRAGQGLEMKPRKPENWTEVYDTYCMNAAAYA